MATNTQFIIPKTPHVGVTKLGTTSAVVKSDGTSSAVTIDVMYCVFATGADGSFLQSIRVHSVASAAATNSVATTFRVFMSTVSTAEGSSAGATTSSNTQLIAETSLGVISSSNSTNATNYQEIPINRAFPTGRYILVAQHLAQTTNQQLQATAFGGDY